jgi:hypothetical protein
MLMETEATSIKKIHQDKWDPSSKETAHIQIHKYNSLIQDPAVKKTKSE